MNTITFEFFPIESAPKDQRLILWDTRFERWTEGTWVHELGEIAYWRDRDYDVIEPTHWALPTFMYTDPNNFEN